ncbi:MAG TPA: CoA transferase [Candidatus Binatia bacterium]|jgi:crotonobetainyl-CoA:carnitine CoA-transferase CaiB-like acyl-CoA transferase
MANVNDSAPPLSGYRVLDLSGPAAFHCTKLLADMGADVVKIEPPGGDPARQVPPFKDDSPHPEKSLYFLHYNTNKRGITLDIEKPEGHAILLELARKADVLIESYQPKRRDELGLSYRELSAVNPALVHESITPFGETGPWRDYKATDIAGLALGNLLYLAGEPGEPPLQPPGEIAYGMASTYGAFGIAVALYHRLESGKGQHIVVSMHECSGHIAGYFIPNFGYTGVKPARASRKGEETDLYDPYPTKNGYARIFIIPIEQWRRLVDWMGRPPSISGPEFEKMAYRRKNPEPVHKAISEFCLRHTKEELYDEGQKRRIAVTPINKVSEFMNSEQVKARETFVEMEHPVIGKYAHFGPVPRLSGSPGRVARTAPLLGEHNEEIFCNELRMSKDDLVALRASGVI